MSQTQALQNCATAHCPREPSENAVARAEDEGTRVPVHNCKKEAFSIHNFSVLPSRTHMTVITLKAWGLSAWSRRPYGTISGL